MAFETAMLAGRVIFGGYFALMGLNHFMKSDQMAGWLEAKEMPSPELLVYLSGVMLLAGGLGVASGAYPAVSLALLGAFLVAVTPTMHDFWNMEGEDRMSNMSDFLKNLALLSALLVMLGASETVFATGIGAGLGIL